MWNDTHRYYTYPYDNPPIFPRPENYSNLDNFLHDISIAVHDEKIYRHNQQLTTSVVPKEFYLLRQSDILFNII